MFSNRELKRMIIPLVIEQILVMLVGIADTVMISYAGEAAISGVAGVAVPTLVSRAVAAVIMAGLSFNGRNEISVCRKQLLSWKRELIVKILRIAVPNGIENGLFALGKVLVTSIVAVFGTTQIAANGIANSVDQIAILAVCTVGGPSVIKAESGSR